MKISLDWKDCCYEIEERSIELRCPFKHINRSTSAHRSRARHMNGRPCTGLAKVMGGI